MLGFRRKTRALGLFALAGLAAGCTEPDPSPSIADNEFDIPQDQRGGPYPSPDAHPRNRGPGAPSISFSTDALFENCTFLTSGPGNDADRHNLVLMFDGYLFMPAAPKFAQGGGLDFFDISDPCSPSLVAHRGTAFMRETHATSVVYNPKHERWFAATAYLEPTHVAPEGTEHNDGGIMIWDTTFPREAEPVATLRFENHDFPDDYDWVTLSVFWQPPFIYAGVANLGVYIVDASDPMNPEVIGRHQFDPVFRVGQVQAVGDLLVVTASEAVQSAVLDISVPEVPQPIPGGTFELVDGNGDVREVYFSTVSGGRIYFTLKSDGGGLLVYDIHDPTNPHYVSHIESPANGGYVFIKDDMAFSGQSEFGAIYDISGMPDIEVMAEFNLPGDLDTLTPIGNLAILSIDNDANPGQAGAVAPYAAEPDTVAPRVTWSVPEDGGSATISSRIGVTMSEMVDIKSVWAGSVRLYEAGPDPHETRVDGLIGVQESIINFAPEEPLRSGTRYVFELPAGGVMDYSGNRMTEPFTMEFTVR